MFSSYRIKDKQIDLEKMNFSVRFQSDFNEFDYIFDVRRTVPKFKACALYLCRLCSYLNKNKIDANKHINEHIQNLYNLSPASSDLPNKYNYFVCTDCHGKIMRRKDIQVHLQDHNSKQISGTVVGVMCKYDKHHNRYYVKWAVHCCEICNFACLKYIDIIKHLKVHTIDEINSADRHKYYRHAHAMDETASYSLDHYADLGDNDDIDNETIPASKWHSGRVKPTSMYKEVEVDNNEKYIPNGWQCKVLCQKSNGCYKVIYISPFGKKLQSADKVLAYIEWLEDQGITEPIDVDKFDFSWLSHNLPKRKPKKRSSGIRSHKSMCM
ncbi:unnamed protein product [Meganyctiphanes norvegica]|uniref:MBD domain-containing protein n=1 Tax=Meganyctiphanes norvegica TaxID=48144 RepID=A0AAV2SM13_MEGNR